MPYSKTKPDYPWYMSRGDFVIMREPGTMRVHRAEIINIGKGKDTWTLHCDDMVKAHEYPKDWCHDPMTWKGIKPLPKIDWDKRRDE